LRWSVGKLGGPAPLGQRHLAILEAIRARGSLNAAAHQLGLATTTSAVDSGLLTALLPPFTSHIVDRPIAVPATPRR
jgi:ABC-type tungstate transport system permease subunit